MTHIGHHSQLSLLRATLLSGLLITACARKSSEPEQAALEPAHVEPPTSSAVPLAPSTGPSVPITVPSLESALTGKDCDSAQNYRDNICELAKKICGTTDDSAGNAAEGTYCSDARTQCDKATQRHREVCD